MYDPTIGQFISEDPIKFEAGDPNLRRYVGNSPTNATDPTGLEAYKKEVNKDGTTSVTVTEQWTIVILYGHGSAKKPHSFHLRNSFQAVGFVGCGAGATNRLIEQADRIPGLMMEEHDIVISPLPPGGDEKKWRKYWWKKAMEGAEARAKEWLTKYPARCKQVTIIPVLAGHRLQNLDQPAEKTVVLTPNDLNGK